MAKFIKKPIFFLILFLLFLVTPIYAAYRVLAPNYLLTEVSKNLPEGSQISVGNIVGKANLEISYENIKILADSWTIFIPHLTVKPLFNLETPVGFLVKEFILKSETMKIRALNIESSIFLKGLTIADFRLKGKFEELNSLEDAIIYHGDFVIAGTNSPSKQLELQAETFDLVSNLPKGQLRLKLLGGEQLFSLNEGLDGQISSDNFKISYSSFDDINEQEFSGSKFGLRFSLTKGSNKFGWLLPVDLTAKSISSGEQFLFSDFKLQAKGEWTGQSDKGCNIQQLFRNEEHCGIMTDVKEANVVIQNNEEVIHFSGDGFCVAPNSGCRQIINASLKSNNTHDFFLRLLEGEAINPVVLSVLMGMLVSSPSEDKNFSHSINIKVFGSEIRVNEKALF